MRFKRFSAMLLALAMCMGVFSTTVFAYSDESATTTTTEKAETVETVPEKTEDKTSEEVPYTVTVNEDGTVVFSFNGKEWTYGAEESEDNNMGTGKVVTSGSRLNVRTGAGMNYEIIDQLRPGEEVVVVGVEGDWYQITVPEKNGYVHSDYLELIEKAEQQFDMQKAQELAEKLKKNRFTLQDYYDQLVQVKGMGSMDELLGMMPGLNTKALEGATINEKALSRTEAIILSMTPQERENPAILNSSRKKRIAAGCGLQVVDVNRLLKEFGMMQQMTKQMSKLTGKRRKGKFGKLPGGMPGLPF